MEHSRKIAGLEQEIARLQSALAAERAKSEGFANASHEVRTLLNGVVGMTALLLDGELSLEQRDNAKRIRASGDALLALVNDFLDFAKAEQGRITLEVGDLDVRRVAEEVGELVAERANARELELVIHVALDIPPLLRGDATRLRQVLINLVTNAIKFTERGEVVLRVSHAERRGAFDVVRFEVTDTGVGIAAPWLERVFEPFTQAGSGHGGTGLGLAIAKRIVEAMGGQLGVTSEVGRGSTFFFTVALERRSATSERAALPRADLGHHRALVVAASSTVRAVLLEHLRALGLDAEARADEDLALSSMETATLRGKPFDFVFAETGSGRRGLELAKRALERPGARAARFVLMSYPGAPRPTLAGNVVAHVWKPLRAPDVATAVLKALAPATEQIELKPERGPDTSEDATRRVTARHTVLVVEDDFVNQKVTVFQLQKRGYLADVASTAREAVERISQQPYALVLLDCHLPGIDGFEAAARIRARERELGLPRTPLVALTADTRPAVRDRCYAAGMDDFLTKPLQGPELDAVLDRCGGPKGRVRRTTANRPAGESLRPPAEPTPTPAPVRRAADRITSEPEPQRASVVGNDRRPTDAAGHLASQRKRHTTTADRHEVATEPPPAPAALDAEALARLKELRKDSGALLLADLVEVFRGDSRARLATLRDAVAKHDPSTFHRTAHALKGSAAQLGVPSVSTLAARLEKLGRAGELREARPLLNALETEIERAYIALIAELETDPSSTTSSIRRNPTHRR